MCTGVVKIKDLEEVKQIRSEEDSVYTRFSQWVKSHGTLLSQQKSHVRISGWEKSGKKGTYEVADPLDRLQYVVMLDLEPQYDDSQVVSVFKIGETEFEPVYLSRYMMRTYKTTPVMKELYGPLDDSISDPSNLQKLLDRWTMV